LGLSNIRAASSLLSPLSCLSPPAIPNPGTLTLVPYQRLVGWKQCKRRVGTGSSIGFWSWRGSSSSWFSLSIKCKKAAQMTAQISGWPFPLWNGFMSCCCCFQNSD
ncbi:unnamed protein product, partial [Musa acuminata subsp. burmannicoides]